MTQVITINQNMIKENLLEAAKEAFETMIMLPLEACDDAVEASGEEMLLIGSITFMGGLKGALIIKCSLKSADKIGRSMLMMGPDDPMSDEEVNDAFGEVVNLVLGGFKAKIAKDIGEIDISVPMVMKAKEATAVTGADSVRLETSALGDGCKATFVIIYKDK